MMAQWLGDCLLEESRVMVLMEQWLGDCLLEERQGVMA